jgi:glycosyltransferase involved in cell wall biosynthesis
MNFLIVDLNIQFDGHKFGFVQETLNWIVKNQEHKFHFLVNQKLEVPVLSNVKVEVLSKVKEQFFNAKSPIQKFKEQWNFIKLKAHQFNAEKVILMEFDIYQMAIGKDKNTNLDISGIWFRPYHRQVSINESLVEELKFYISHLRKKLAFNFALRNKNLKKVFVLNDKQTVNVLNEKFGDRLFYLPDPVFEIAQDSSIDIHSKYNIKSQQIIFLLFGYIDQRKNVLNIIEALRNLPPQFKSKVSLLIIGKMSSHYNELLNNLNEDLNLQIIKNNDFVSDSEMNTLFKESDLILRMNINFFASSGILGMAAKHNKPSIVSNYGVVADLTQEYKLGKIVDPMNTNSLTILFQDFIENQKAWKIDGQPYYHDHNTDAFVGTLLGI